MVKRQLFIGHKLKQRKLATALLVVLSAGGCAVGPDYQQPAVETPTNWRLAEGEVVDLANTTWWRLFQDPVLDRLIQTSLENNKDIRIAAATVEEFIGRYGATRADQFPQVSYDALAERRRSTESDLAPGIDPINERYQVDLGVLFEIDLWGRLRRATEAARADLLATDEAKRTVILTLVAAVADSYVRLRELDKRLGIARNTLGTREESLRIARRRFEAGLTSELPFRQAQADYEGVALTIPQLERAIAQQENLLSVLLGRNPSQIPRGSSLDQLVQPGVPQGLPSDLLERRPDIRQAEQELIAANARIGVARAEYFPSISLTGVLGSASKSLSDLFSGPAQTWAYGGSLLGPIFTGGRITGQVQAAEARQQQALARYEKTIQTAFAEVEDSLIDVSKSREEFQVQSKQVEAYGEYARLARLSYDNGYISYLEVVDAERNLFNSEQALAQSQSRVFQALINLYKAMGGGWVVKAEELASSYPVPKNSSTK